MKNFLFLRKKRMIINLLKNYWLKAFNDLTDNKDLIEKYFQKVILLYQHSGHFYHNLEHLKNFMEAIEPFWKDCEHVDELILSVFYHDAVYDTFRTDNEEKSAQLARADLKELGLDYAKRIRIMKLIRCTANHVMKKDEENYCLSLFLDGDLKILGESREKYMDYAQSIRKEYIRVPDRIFRRKRAKILEAFLGQKFIYCTPEFRNLYEKNARENIGYELRM